MKKARNMEEIRQNIYVLFTRYPLGRNQKKSFVEELSAALDNDDYQAILERLDRIKRSPYSDDKRILEFRSRCKGIARDLRALLP